VVVRIHNTEKHNYPNEDYFVARLLENPQKLEQAGMYGTNHFNAGWFIVQMQWYEKKETNGSGNSITNLEMNL
jgi:hypothetical protein